MIQYAKEYLEKHKDTVMTVAAVLLLDHFFLGGALRDRVKALLEKLLAGAERKLALLPEEKK